MKTAIKPILLNIILVVISLSVNAQISEKYKVSKEQELKTEIAKIWVDNAIYTRQAILCLTDRLPGSQETLYRLMVNQEQMGEVFNKYYGRKLGDEFCQLLSSNTSIVIRIIRSKNDKDTNDLINSQNKMVKHYSDIVDFLVKINPHYNKKDLEKEIAYIVELMNKQIDYRIRGLYDLDIENFDKIISESILFANILSEGIIKLYPKEFLEN